MKMLLGFLIMPVAIIATAIGCGGDGGPAMSKVTGKVNYKGQPLSGANVTFMYDDGNMAAGQTDSSGSFTLTTGGRSGAPIGKAEVLVSKIPADDTVRRENMTPDDYQKMMAAGESPIAATPKKSPIPERYQTTGQSGLTADVVADESQNVFEFNLVD